MSYWTLVGRFWTSPLFIGDKIKGIYVRSIEGFCLEIKWINFIKFVL